MKRKKVYLVSIVVSIDPEEIIGFKEEVGNAFAERFGRCAVRFQNIEEL